MKIYVNETTAITKTELNKITRRKLEENIVGETAGGQKFSEVNGVEYMWDYRRQDGIWNPVCKKEDADQITIYSNVDCNVKLIKTIYF